MEQINICINGIREALVNQESITAKVIKELTEYGVVSTKTAIQLERSRKDVRDSELLLQQIEEAVNKH